MQPTKMLGTSDAMGITSSRHGASALPVSTRLERTHSVESGPWEPRELGPVPEQLLESFGISRTASCQEPEISAGILGRPDLVIFGKGHGGRASPRQEGGTGQDTAQRERKRVSEDPPYLREAQKKR